MCKSSNLFRFRWFHFSELIQLHSIFGDKMEFRNFTEIVECRFEKLFEEPVNELARQRIECEARNDKIGSSTAKGFLLLILCSCQNKFCIIIFSTLKFW